MIEKKRFPRELSQDLRWQTKHTNQRGLLKEDIRELITCWSVGARLRNVCEKSTADFAFVVETRIVYLNAMIERNSNLPIFILHLYFFF